MTYLVDERSVTSSRPVELYEFTAPSTTYRYVSNYHTDYSFGGDTYTLVAIRRSAIAGTSQNDPPAVDIDCDSDLDVVQDFLRDQERSLVLKITRVQQVSGESRVVWEGAVAAITVEGDRGKIRSHSSFGSRLDSAISGVSFQPLCNHRLYDDRCAILESNHRTVTTVSSITDSTTIVVAAVGSDTHKDGELIHVSSGERRLIVDQSGTTLTISSPFPAIAVSDSVQVLAGCDHTVQTCRDTFANVVNFGGHPYVPSINPVLAGLKAAEIFSS